MKEYYLPGKEEIFYRKNLFKKRKTIVFIHGLTGSSSAWIPYEKIFEKKYNLLSIDLRGHGKSFRPKGQENYKLNKFTDDIYKVLMHEKISKCIMVGHSFGSIILLNFLKRHMKSVSSAIFISSTYTPSKRIISRVVKPFYYIGDIFSLKKYGNHVDYKNFKDTGDWNLRRIYADVSNTGLHSHFHSLRHISNFNGEDILKKIDIPVLMIHGNADTIFLLEHAKEMHSKLKNAELVVIDKADHVIILNNIKELSELIDAFVGK